MWIIAYIFLALATVLSFIAAQSDAGASAIRVSASEEIKQYKSFIVAADSFFADAERPPQVRFQWAQIQESAPPSIKSAQINSVWYAVKGEDGTWAACTDLSEEAMANIAKVFPDPEVGLKVQTINGFFTVGDADTAAAAAALCKKGVS